MAEVAQLVKRAYRSAVAWSWVMNGLRLASGVLLLPLLIQFLSEPDFGMYFVFLGLSALVPILDFGFSASIGRAVSYAMGGATELKADGFVPAENPSGPNHILLWQLLHTTRRLYAALAIGTLVLLGVLGTAYVALKVQETSVPMMTWIAWGITLISCVWEIYAGWWNVYLRSLDQVLVSARLAAWAQGLKIAVACVLLVFGGGLLSVPIGTLVANLVQRSLSRREVLRHLKAGHADTEAHRLQTKQLFETLWPNSWRIGVQFLSGYLAGYANTLIAGAAFGLKASATYGFSLQLVSISSGMAAVWTFVKWPAIGKARIQQDYAGMRRLFWSRVWLQYLTYLALAVGVVLVVPALLKWFHSEKTLLPGLWLALLALVGFLEMNYSLWGTVISTENRTPFVWPIVITNVVSFLLVLGLVGFTTLGLAAFVIAPLVTGAFCNYWRWPLEGARSLQTTWLRFLFRRE
jgi:O-antigen/teichoic acid export membrane protein